MDTTYLKEFLVMSELCNYTAAAESMFISQPTLYKHIKSLEAEVGVPLFEKHGKKIELSRFGKMLIPYAQSMLSDQQQYLMDVDTELQERANSLRIATNYRIKDLVRDFFRENRQCKIHTISSPSLEKAFANPDCELALFCCEDAPGEQYEYIKYCEEEVVVAVNLAHPLAQRATVRLHELRNEEFITLFSDSFQFVTPSFEFSKVFDYFQPKATFNVERGSEAAQMISQGLGISLLFRRAIEAQQEDDLVLISLNPPVYCPVYLCWRKGCVLSNGAKIFVNYIQNRADK